MNEINLKSNTQSRNFSNYETSLGSFSTALIAYAESVQKIQDTIAPTLIAYAESVQKFQDTIAPTLIAYAESVQKIQDTIAPTLIAYAETVQKIQDTIAPTLIAYADTISKILESQGTFEIDDLQKTALDFFDEEFLSSIPDSLETLDEIIPTTPETESLKAEVATMKKSFAEKITIGNIIQFFTFIDFVCKLIGIPSPFDTPSPIINETTNINIQIVDHDCTEGIIETLDIINNSETIE